MKFNPLQRGAKKEANTEQKLNDVLKSQYICTIAVNDNGVPMMLPMAFGYKNETIYLHGSLKNHVLNQALESDTVCVSVHQTDGLVLAQTLFNTGLNYRSVILFGKAEKITDPQEHMEALEIITNQIIPGRWDEVNVGTDAQVNATFTVKIPIDSATVKIREGGPSGDEDLNEDVWSGQIPIKTVACPPKYDVKRLQFHGEDESVKLFYLKHKF